MGNEFTDRQREVLRCALIQLNFSQLSPSEIEEARVCYEQLGGRSAFFTEMLLLGKGNKKS